MGSKPIKKLLRASLELFEAQQTGVLYGTNASGIKYLPTSTWDRGIMDEFDGKGVRGLVLKLFGSHIVTSKGMSPILFYETNQRREKKETNGIIAHVLRHCADYYEKGINIIICPDTLKVVHQTEEKYFQIPFYVYNGRCIEKSREMIWVNVGIVRHFNSKNSIYIYLPDYGILVINNAETALLERNGDEFVREDRLTDRLDLLSRMVDTASLENLGLLRGKKGAQLLWHKEKHLRKISRELIENEKNFRDLYQTAPLAYLSMDTKGVILNCNQRAQELCGYDRADLIGRNVDSFLFRDSEKNRITENIRDKLLQGDHIKEMELRMKPGSGGISWVSISIEAVKDRKDNVIELRAMIMDISDRKNLEKQLLQSRKMEAVGRFSGGIAHDFNNILSPVSGYAQMLLMDTAKEDPRHAQLNIIKDCVDRAQDLVSQMLTFSKQKEQVLKPVNLLRTVEEAMTLVRSSLPSTIRLDISLEETGAMIMGDAVQIHQVIMSLVTHAFQAIGDRSGHLGIRLSSVIDEKQVLALPSAGKNSTVCLSIEDDGDSMDAKTCDKLFDPYFSRENETRESGIGLCVVHGIVESHGGRIQVESQKGRGNRFDLFFPVCRKIDLLPDMSTVLPAAETAQGVMRTGSEHILLVDDDKKVADMQCFMLEKLGYTVSSFLDPVKAITYFKAHVQDLDLVITDLTMSGLNGIELSNHIQLIQPGFPVILCSGLSEPVTREKLETAAVKGFLKKPISVHELSRALVQVLDRPA